MQLLTDLHLHSKYARGCSKDLTLANMEKWARIKGIDILGTGDFTHPLWNKEIKSQLTEKDGLLYSKTEYPFMLTTEISLIYSQDGKGRRIHNIVWAPSLDAVDHIIDWLGKKGRLDYDGRPIFKIPCPEFVSELKKIDTAIEVIPAHIWTPWFSLYGANSGFDSIKDAFQDQEKNVRAIETGMSSDPAMNWRIKELHNKAIVSFSDSHSFWPWRLGREATIFDVKEKSYSEIIKALHNNNIERTIEVDPNYGKYHFTGHRNCGVVLNPVEAEKHQNICPECKKKLTIGVMERIEQLANLEPGTKSPLARPFSTLLPLQELIAGWLGMGLTTKKVWEIQTILMKTFGNEYEVLLRSSEESLGKVVDPRLAEIILKNRSGQIQVKAGFDGVYGVPLIHGTEDYKLSTDLKHVPWHEEKDLKKQKTLGEF